MNEEFKARLNAHAVVAIDRAKKSSSEAATSQYLVLPFFQLLGYDPLDPEEVIPEAHASFSDKFKNRVDYAICKDSVPVVAVECKRVGTLSEGHRGELKGYFNAVPSVKLGVLTDGLVFELYSDTREPNLMDDEPFVRIDLTEVAAGRIGDHALDALLRLQKGTFDPADVGSDARKKIYVGQYLRVLEQNFRTPAEPFLRGVMDVAQIEGRRTTKMVEEHGPYVFQAMQAFLDKKILERVGFAERADLVRVEEPAAAAPVAAAVAEAPPEVVVDSGIVTTETELGIYEYARTRLAFLVRDEELFHKLTSHLRYEDFKTTFTVYYKQVRKGRLFNFRAAAASPRFRFEFPDVAESIDTDSLADIDTALLTAFTRRVAELG
jgi:predicted type IV restriction endonuclease